MPARIPNGRASRSSARLAVVSHRTRSDHTPTRRASSAATTRTTAGAATSATTAPRAPADEDPDDTAGRGAEQLHEGEDGPPGDEAAPVERAEHRREAGAGRERERSEQDIAARRGRVAGEKRHRHHRERRRHAEPEAGEQRAAQHGVGAGRVAADPTDDDGRGAEVGEEAADHHVRRRGRVLAERGGGQGAGGDEHEPDREESAAGLERREREGNRGWRPGRRVTRRPVPTSEARRSRQRPSRPMTERTVRPTMRTSRPRLWRRR